MLARINVGVNLYTGGGWSASTLTVAVGDTVTWSWQFTGSGIVCRVEQTETATADIHMENGFRHMSKDHFSTGW